VFGKDDHPHSDEEDDEDSLDRVSLSSEGSNDHDAQAPCPVTGAVDLLPTVPAANTPFASNGLTSKPSTGSRGKSGKVRVSIEQVVVVEGDGATWAEGDEDSTTRCSSRPISAPPAAGTTDMKIARSDSEGSSRRREAASPQASKSPRSVAFGPGRQPSKSPRSATDSRNGREADSTPRASPFGAGRQPSKSPRSTSDPRGGSEAEDPGPLPPQRQASPYVSERNQAGGTKVTPRGQMPPSFARGASPFSFGSHNESEGGATAPNFNPTPRGGNNRRKGDATTPRSDINNNQGYYMSPMVIAGREEALNKKKELRQTVASSSSGGSGSRQAKQQGNMVVTNSSGGVKPNATPPKPPPLKLPVRDGI